MSVTPRSTSVARRVTPWSIERSPCSTACMCSYPRVRARKARNVASSQASISPHLPPGPGPDPPRRERDEGRAGFDQPHRAASVSPTCAVEDHSQGVGRSLVEVEEDHVAPLLLVFRLAAALHSGEVVRLLPGALGVARLHDAPPRT